MFANFPGLPARWLKCLCMAGFCLSACVRGQNIVPNPSFEQNLLIPQTVSQSALILDWDNASPSVTTPDYFHVLCPNPGVVQLPSNVWGNTLPFDGQAVAGLYCYAPQNYREYLRTQFLTPMLPGQQYLVRFAITMGIRDSSALNLGATDGFGVYFSVNAPSQGAISAAYTQELPLNPQWQLPGVFGASTWQVMLFNIWPDTTWNYATLGNFRDNQNTFQESSGAVSYLFIDRVEIVPVLTLSGPVSACEGDSLWYVASPPGGDYQWLVNNVPVGSGDSLLWVATDSAEVVLQAPGTARTRKLTIRKNPVVNLGPDIFLCEGDSALISFSPQPNWTWLWSNGETGSSQVLEDSGRLILAVDSLGCRASDTVTILLGRPPEVVLVPDTALCEDDSLTLFLPSADSWQWSDGSTDSIQTFSSGGWIWGLASNECGTASDSVWITSVAIPTVDLPPDTRLCDGDSLLLSPSPPVSGQFFWQDGFPTLERAISQSGTYSLTFANQCGNSSDQITLSLETTPQVSIEGPAILCEGESVRLTAFGTANVWNWSTGESGSEIVVGMPGEFILTGVNECGANSDTLLISGLIRPTADLGKDTVLCEGESLLLEVDPASGQIFWEDGSEFPVRRIDSAGEYAVTVGNECGRDADAIRVTVDKPQFFQLPADTVICEGDILLLPRPDGVDHFQWPDGSDGPVWTVEVSEAVIANARNACGIVADTMQVEVVNCDCRVYVPNAFSPNGDGVNDQWFVSLDCPLMDFEAVVMDRWGKRLLTFSTPDFRWSGVGIPEGVYVWQIRYRWGAIGQNPVGETLSGTVTLIR